jgi:hypothetical protein
VTVSIMQQLAQRLHRKNRNFAVSIDGANRL